MSSERVVVIGGGIGGLCACRSVAIFAAIFGWFDGQSAAATFPPNFAWVASETPAATFPPNFVWVAGQSVATCPPNFGWAAGDSAAVFPPNFACVVASLPEGPSLMLPRGVLGVSPGSLHCRLLREDASGTSLPCQSGYRQCSREWCR